MPVIWAAQPLFHDGPSGPKLDAGQTQKSEPPPCRGRQAEGAEFLPATGSWTV